jgi:hypothetical protein
VAPVGQREYRERFFLSLAFASKIGDGCNPSLGFVRVVARPLRRAFLLGRHRPYATTSEDLNRSQPDVSTRPDFRLFPLFCALLFPLFSIVVAPAAFL